MPGIKPLSITRLHSSFIWTYYCAGDTLTQAPRDLASSRCHPTRSGSHLPHSHACLTAQARSPNLHDPDHTVLVVLAPADHWDTPSVFYTDVGGCAGPVIPTKTISGCSPVQYANSILASPRTDMAPMIIHRISLRARDTAFAYRRHRLPRSMPA